MHCVPTSPRWWWGARTQSQAGQSVPFQPPVLDDIYIFILCPQKPAGTQSMPPRGNERPLATVPAVLGTHSLALSE